jgi:hypothetical protein
MNHHLCSMRWHNEFSWTSRRSKVEQGENVRWMSDMSHHIYKSQELNHYRRLQSHTTSQQTSHFWDWHHHWGLSLARKLWTSENIIINMCQCKRNNRKQQSNKGQRYLVDPSSIRLYWHIAASQTSVSSRWTEPPTINWPLFVGLVIKKNHSSAPHQYQSHLVTNFLWFSINVNCRKSSLEANLLTNLLVVSHKPLTLLDRIYQSNTSSHHRKGTVCPHCETRLTWDHFLWECQGTKAERDRIAINNNIWQTGLAGLAKLIEYTKKIGIFHEICRTTRIQRHTHTTRHWKPKNGNIKFFSLFIFCFWETFKSKCFWFFQYKIVRERKCRHVDSDGHAKCHMHSLYQEVLLPYPN